MGASSNNNWLSDFDDDLVTYRGLFSTNLTDFSELELSSRRRRDIRQRVFFFCAVTSLVLLLPPALVVLAAVRRGSRADSALALVAYVLFALAVLGVCCVFWRGLAICRAVRRSARVYRAEQPNTSTVDEESALLGPSSLPCAYPPSPSPLLAILPPPRQPPPPPLLPLPPPPLPPPPSPPICLLIAHQPPVRLPQPVSTTARPILAQPCCQAPPTAATSGRWSPIGGSTSGHPGQNDDAPSNKGFGA